MKQRETMMHLIFRHLKVKLFGLVLISILSITLSGKAQSEPVSIHKSKEYVYLNHSKYFIHKATPGQTLYAISKTYEVSLKVIYLENPDLVLGLKAGMTLKIPAVEIKDPIPEIEKDYGNFNYHIVKKQETLYSLSKMYKVHVNEIIKNNPGAEEKLQIGQELKIPKTDIKKEYENLNSADDQFVYHKVKAKETIFGLSRLYKVKVRTIKENNPGLKWGLDIGQIIKIPLQKDLISIRPEDRIKEILPGENMDILTLDSISNENPEKSDLELPESTLSIPTDTIDFYYQEISLSACDSLMYPNSEEESYNVALLLPFYTNINDTLGINDTIPSEYEKIYRGSYNFMDFYEGSLLALEKLKKQGMNIRLFVYDTERDASKVRAITYQRALRSMDLIIGPVYSEPLEVMAEFAKDERIPMISPLSTRSSILERNPYVFQVNSSEDTQYSKAASYISKFYDKNIIIIRNTLSYQNPSMEHYRNEIYGSLSRNYFMDNVLVKDIVFNDSTLNLPKEDTLSFRLEDALSVGMENIIIIPSEDEVFVSDLLNKLNSYSTAYRIRVFGLPKWAGFRNIETESLFNLNYHYYTNFRSPFINHKNPMVNDFYYDYRKNFKHEPSLFSIQGYDVSYFFLSGLFHYGEKFYRCVPCVNRQVSGQLIKNDFLFMQRGRRNGFENQAIGIVRYDKESMEIILEGDAFEPNSDK